MQLLWLKRDLRLAHHEPLQLALARAKHPGAGPVVVTYFHEPSLLGRPDASAQHLAFVQECLQDLENELRTYGSALLVITAEAPAGFEALHATRPLTHLWAHQEVTHLAGFERDKAVARWARSAGVPFSELPQNGVRRGPPEITPPFDFSAHVRQAMEAPAGYGALSSEPLPAHGRGRKKPFPGLLPAQDVEQLKASVEATLDSKRGPRRRDPKDCLQLHRPAGWLQDAPAPALSPLEDKALRLSGGRAAALEHLERFLAPDNLLAYPNAISSPMSALQRCSRLSPYLAWGVLSDQEVLRALALKTAQESEALTDQERQPLLSAGRFFVERLYWRSAYLQSAERYALLDTQAELSAFAGVRESERMHGWLQAWAAGKTGFPFVDAAMRMLNATGWLNMRLRGTVTSFAVNDLWLPWQEVGMVLAREFLDYEPAIHWSQLQIHAGVSARNEPLTYDIVKQARDHDPKGVFVRQWVPELRTLPLEWLFEPWKTPPAVQRSCGVMLGQDYPLPVVRHPAANDAARQRVSDLRSGKPTPASLFWKERARALAQQGQAQLF